MYRTLSLSRKNKRTKGPRTLAGAFILCYNIAKQQSLMFANRRLQTAESAKRDSTKKEALSHARQPHTHLFSFNLTFSINGVNKDVEIQENQKNNAPRIPKTLTQFVQDSRTPHCLRYPPGTQRQRALPQQPIRFNQTQIHSIFSLLNLTPRRPYGQ